MPTPEELELTKKLFVLLNKDQRLVAEYVKKHGLEINAKYLKEIKDLKTKKPGSASTAAGMTPLGVSPVLAARQARLNAINESNASAAALVAAQAANKFKAQQANAAALESTEDQDPVFETTVICPVCGRGGITCYELRAKSQQVMQTALLVPKYTAAKGFKTVDYSLYSVTVCPDCLFASPDKKNFNFQSFSGTSEEKSTLSVGVILDLKDRVSERKELLPAAAQDPEYFRREKRTPKVAMESYRLAMARAKVEADLSQPYGYFKMGSYALKIAHIMKCNGEDDTEVLKESLELLEKSFSRSECKDDYEAQVVYMIIALHIRLRDLTKANSYLGLFNKLLNERQEAMKTNPALKTAIIEKWQERARYLWEERENLDALETLR